MWSGICGTVCGVIVFVVYRFFRDYIFAGFVTGLLSKTAFSAVSFIGISLLVLPLSAHLLRRCQRPVIVYLCGQWFGSCLFFGILAASWYRRPDSIGHWGEVILIPLVIVVALVVGAITGLAHLLLRELVRAVGFGIIEQTGSLCYSCGYELRAHRQGARCPECGRVHFSRERRPTTLSRLLGKGKRLSRPIGLVFFAALLVLLVVRGMLRSHVLASEFTHIDSHARPQRMTMMNLVQRAGGLTIGGGWEEYGIVRAIDGHLEMRLLVCKATAQGPLQPAMQLQLVAASEYGYAYGDPVIVCNLTPTQAAHISANGVPSALEKALVDLAIEHKWKPSLPGPNTFGGFVELDPEPFFTD